MRSLYGTGEWCGIRFLLHFPGNFDHVGETVAFHDYYIFLGALFLLVATVFGGNYVADLKADRSLQKGE